MFVYVRWFTFVCLFTCVGLCVLVYVCLFCLRALVYVCLFMCVGLPLFVCCGLAECYEPNARDQHPLLLDEGQSTLLDPEGAHLQG